MKSSQFAPLAIACALSIVSATATFAVDPITSTWSGQDANSDWFDAGNWSAGVPSQAGDVAIIRSNSIATRRPVLSGPVSLGELQFLMLSGQATVGGTGLVTFDQPGDAPARLVVGTPTPTEATLSTPWGVAAGETLRIEVPTSRTLLLLGTMTSAEGDIELSGGGVADFRLGNAAWNGDLAVRGGILRVRQGAVFGSTAGLTSIHAGGTLEIATSNAINEPMQLNGGSLEVSTSNNGISGPIAVDADSRIHARSNFQLQSNLTGPGGLALSGLASNGTLFVSGDNSYQGLTVVSGGRVTVRSANGLGATTAGTQIKTGGHLQLEAPTAEPLLLQGGTVYLTSAATATGPVTMESGTFNLTADGNYQQPITLAGKGSPITIAGRSQLTGGVVGTGDLIADGMVQVHTNPLSHQGGLNVSGEWILDGPNTYTGNTHVTGILEANHPQALGLSDSPVTVDGGVLRLGAAFTRDIYLASGGLNVPDAGTVIDGQVRLNASSRSPLNYGYIQGKGTFNGEIVFEPSTYSRATVNGGQFNGTITGSVDLLTVGSISPEATQLNTNNSYRGMTLVQNGRVEANAARALGSADDGTMVSYGQLDLNVDVDEPIIVDHSGKVLVNVQQSRLPRMFRTDMFNPPRTQELVINHAGTYPEHVEAAEGTLRVNHNTTITGATIREGGGVVVADGATLTLADEVLELQSGSLSGRIEGVGLLRKTSGFEARVSNLQGFDGRIDIESGRLRVLDGGGLGTGNGATHLTGQNSVLFFNLRDGGTFDDDIYLNNSQGDLRVPALYVARVGSSNASVRLAGTLDLGSQGSSLGGPDSLSTSDEINLYLAGQVTGGSVSTYGRRAMFFVETPNADYTGDTNLVQGTMVLTGEGRLNSTSAIHLHEVEASHKGTLELANRVTSRDDRIDDEIPLHFHGGELSSFGAMNERVGIGHFHPGDSRIELTSSSDELEVDKRLTFAALQRAPGATVVVSTGASQQLHVDQPIELIEGILPWMMVSERHSSSSATSGFATLTTGGLTPIPFVPQSWSGANQSDHMGIDASNTSLDSSATVASLGFGNSSSPLDLNGHSLIVKSGGISLGNGGQINNGTLSTGPDGFNELLFYGRGAVSANIVEDPAAGPLAVTFSPGTGTSNVVYSGNNSYTGPTFVNEGQLDVFTRTALPTGTDLILNGGDVTLRYDSTAANKFGTIRIAGDGSIRSVSGQNAIQFDELQLQQGEVREIRLAGSGTIRKTTDDDALLVSTTSSGFSGNILVEQGHLGVFGSIPGPIRVTGGSVGVGGGNNPITLDGGALMLGQSPLSSASTYKGNGSIHVASPSKIMGIGIDRVDEAITGTITGAGSLEFTADGLIQQAMGSTIRVSSNNPNFSGDVSIDSLAIELWHSHSLGTGNISVGSGGILSLIGPSHMVVPGDVRLVGGEIRGRSYETEAHELAGDLFVTGRSRVGGVNVLGTTHLENGSSLTVSGQYGTQFVGEMVVGGNVDLEYGLPSLYPGSINLGQDNLLQIRGTVSAGATGATLNFVDRGLVDFQVSGTLKANAGQVLNIRKDGERFVLPLQGPTAGIAGDGTVNGDFALAGEATLAPGQSPGTLVVEGDLELGPGAAYQWELGGSAWDLVHVDGKLTFSSTVGEPWQLVLSEYQTEMAYVDSEWLIATADEILGFDPSMLEIVTTGLSDRIRNDAAAEFFVEQRGGELYLVLAVPEPSTMVVAMLLVAGGVVLQRRKRTCRSK